MLDFELTENHAGIVLLGDVTTLRSLHGLIVRICRNPELDEDDENFFLELANDIRKAYEGKREADLIRRERESVWLYGVRILWPTLIAQVGQMRAALSFIPSTRLDQSIMYGLEYVVETAFTAAAPAEAPAINAALQQLRSSQPRIEGLMLSRCCYFVSLLPAERLTKLAQILDALNPIYRVPAGVNPPFRGGLTWRDFEPFAHATELPTFDW